MRARDASRVWRMGASAVSIGNGVAIAAVALAAGTASAAAGEATAEMHVSIRVVDAAAPQPPQPLTLAEIEQREQTCQSVMINCLGASPGRVSVEPGTAGSPFAAPADGNAPSMSRTRLSPDQTDDRFTILIEY